jgi:TetR/AcrR family transcriptional regulator
MKKSEQDSAVEAPAGPNTTPNRRPTGRRDGGETRERILTAGLDVFSENGFDGTTTRAIAARAGVNLGLIKYHFGSKEELWRAAVDRVFESLWQVLASLDPGVVDDPSRASTVVRTAVRFAARNPAFVRLMNDECKRDSPRMRWLTDRHGKRLYDASVAALEHARAEGTLPDISPIHLFYMFIGAVGMIFSQAPECERLTGIDPTTSDEMIEQHADAIEKLFLTAAR